MALIYRRFTGAELCQGPLMATVRGASPQMPQMTRGRLKIAVERLTYQVDRFLKVSDHMWGGQKMFIIEFGTLL